MYNKLVASIILGNTMQRFVVFLFFICISNIYSYTKFINASDFAYIVIDGATGKILEQKNAEQKRHPASLTKMMTLYLLFEQLKSKKITLETKFRVSKLAQSQERTNLGLREGSYISVKNIILALIVKSANDMAVTAAEGVSGSVAAFTNLMNFKAKTLGMKNTFFHNPSGLPHHAQISTAKDMATLSQALFKNFKNEYLFFNTKSFSYNNQILHSHNKLLTNFNGVDGIKTGYTNASRFNISVSAQKIGKNGMPVRLFAVVLGGKTSFARDAKVISLLNSNFKKLGVDCVQCEYNNKSTNKKITFKKKNKITFKTSLVKKTNAKDDLDVLYDKI